MSFDNYKKYAPFCHGTNLKSAERIDKHGLEATGISQYIGSQASKKDRIYFGTMRERNGIQKCIESAKYASRNKGEDNMVLYILDEIPNDCIPVVDEDVNRGFDEELIDPLKSLEYIKSFGLSKCIILPKDLKKLNPKEFHTLAKKIYPDIMNWENFKKIFIND